MFPISTTPYIKESLFEDKTSERLEKIHKAVDVIKNRFGEDAIKRGASKYID